MAIAIQSRNDSIHHRIPSHPQNIHMLHFVNHKLTVHKNTKSRVHAPSPLHPPFSQSFSLTIHTPGSHCLTTASRTAPHRTAPHRTVPFYCTPCHASPKTTKSSVPSDPLQGCYGACNLTCESREPRSQAPSFPGTHSKTLHYRFLLTCERYPPTPTRTTPNPTTILLSSRLP
ncbi:hypothetical protein BU24DRAFT_419319 [Aaosphaeria arxii CBS 175.79]|uniref:Uncharacterized protein n=1 Tax=Aaosphaeria arxii CBS 175.79 TaxID=1450172 RepID=A0A6A5Y369_9PLEO|nr:uncharacterized protein BU24DRAFT_419319 [Aaosphaeria arxii CBS 175.79]KAF2019693.1 hypothetical protein BU24DRAFT_419319 [Aaosphaeria arxii CBS 175.79]